MRTSLRLLVLVVGACGGDDESQLTGNDAGADAVSDAGIGFVEIFVKTWTGTGVGDESAIVVFSDPNGVVIQHGQVDASGHMTSTLPDGGSVTVLQARNDPNNFYTRFDHITHIRFVEPGDVLHVGRERTTTSRTGVTSVMYATDADGYLFTSCGEGGLGNPRPLTFYADCVTPTFDVLRIVDEQGTNIRQYAWQPDVAYVPDGTFAAPSALQAMPTSTVTFEHTPSNRMNVGAFMYALVDDIAYEMDRRFIDVPPAGTNQVSVLYAPIASPAIIVGSHSQGLLNPLERYTVVTSSPADVTIDWDTLSVPVPSQVTQSADHVSWTQSAAGSGDARVVLWSAQYGDANGVTHHTLLEIVEPVDGPAMTTLPTLPAAYTDDDPTGKTLTLKGANVSYVDHDHLAGYAEAREFGPDVRSVEIFDLLTEHRAHMSSRSSY